jgi:hypothetical protein
LGPGVGDKLGNIVRLPTPISFVQKETADKFQNHSDELKSDTKEYILYNSIYMKLQGKQISSSDRKQISGHLGWKGCGSRD